jgi:neutral amino acid transport system permease protein
VFFALSFALLSATQGIHDVIQTTVNGIVSGSYLALGAAGLTLIFALLRLVNFAYGDYMTFGVYTVVLLQGNFGDSLAADIVIATVVVAALSLALEFVLWRPLRTRGAGFFQLVIASLGLAYIIRYGLQVVLGANERQLNVDVIGSTEMLGIRVGTTQLIVTVVALVVMLIFAVALGVTRAGKMIRAVADNRGLAETSGINTSRVILLCWVISGALAGLAGIIYAAPIGYVSPTLGYSVVLGIFVAAVLGGIGSVYGALAGGLLLGVVQEWSTLLITPQLKIAVGFCILIAVLLVTPRGIFGRRPTVEAAS